MQKFHDNQRSFHNYFIVSFLKCVLYFFMNPIPNLFFKFGLWYSIYTEVKILKCFKNWINFLILTSSFLILRIIKMLKLKIMNIYLQHLCCTKQLVFTVQCFTVQCFMHNPIWIEAGIWLMDFNDCVGIVGASVSVWFTGSLQLFLEMNSNSFWKSYQSVPKKGCSRSNGNNSSKIKQKWN